MSVSFIRRLTNREDSMTAMTVLGNHALEDIDQNVVDEERSMRRWKAIKSLANWLAAKIVYYQDLLILMAAGLGILVCFKTPFPVRLHQEAAEHLDWLTQILQ